MIRFIDVAANTDAVKSWMVGFCVAVLIPLTSTAAIARSHPPQRPLPTAMDDALTRGPAYYVDPARGNDADDGSVSMPWQTMQHGVRQLKPGDTLYLRGGVYYETVYLARSGTAQSPIVVAAYPGELPVLDGGLREFLESPDSSWEPEEDGAPDEYASIKTYVHAADRRTPHQFLPGSWEPMWGLEDERPLALGHFADSMVPLHGYRTVEDLRSTNERQPQNKAEGTVYCGPGLWFNRKTNRIHIRLSHHKLPGLGDRAYRGETDPRKLSLVVAVGFGEDVLRVNGIKHVRIRGLVLRGATGSPYVYRNIFDQRAGVYYGLPKEPGPSGAFLHHEGHLLSDHGSPVYPVMRVYHNTFLRREPVWRNYFLFGLGGRALRDTERDVFNNLFVQADRVPGAVVHGKEAGPMREGGNLLWGVNEGPTMEVDPFAKLRSSPLFKDSQRFYAPGWTTNDVVADPKFVKLADTPEGPSDLRLSGGSSAIDAGLVIPAEWPDPLRGEDKGKPDIGAVPLGVTGWDVGVDGRISVFGGTTKKAL